MSVEKDLLNGQLIYTFGPSGCSFEPAAEIWISWKELDTQMADLFYIDEANQYIEQNPEDIDFTLKRFKVLISHFSRYAVAYSD